MKKLFSGIKLVHIFLFLIGLCALIFFFPLSQNHVLMDTISPVVAIIDEGGMIGTGTLIDETTVLTSRHILEPGKRYGVRFSDTRIEWAQVRATHPILDIALLSLKNPRKSEYYSISHQNATVGLSVVALGIQSEEFSLKQLH
jgi:S1-C subfamily serine protease